ncbi:ATP-binding protein [Zobellia uliginosa]|uniref:ATP-binding protein n=1 Tax=Zobellia uliginosa TaxID=143224 RepID=UPI001C06CB17|nr:ATP-binding protein [Zobellia uliginosa]MBU2948053.1 ATP-binding protein [Zobellia uliginosa]
MSQTKRLFYYYLESAIKYKFRSRTIFFLALTWLIPSLLAELANYGTDFYIEKAINVIKHEIGSILYSLFTFLYYLFFGLLLSLTFSWVSIIIKSVLIVFFGILELFYKKEGPLIIYKKARRLKINEAWFNELSKKFYSQEIKSKYVNGLHQDLQFQKNQLDLILRFNDLKKSSLEIINDIEIDIKSFENIYNEVSKIIKDTQKNLPNYRPYQTFPNTLYTQLFEIKRILKINRKSLNRLGFKTLKSGNSTISLELNTIQYINYKSPQKSDFENWEKYEQETFRQMLDNYNNIISAIYSLNQNLHKLNKKSIFIVGNAGVGKTHLSAHLSAEIKKESNYPILISAKKFSGESTDLNRVFLNLLEIDSSYQLRDILLRINKFAIQKNCRVYFIIDGLNETTDDKIGFNKMWKFHLESFTSQIDQFSHLFLIGTLRESYVDRVWSQRPKDLLSLDGFNHYDVREACDLYFNHFKINVSNLKIANLDFFRVPLLLDLFCKLKNGPRAEVVTIVLNVHSYIEIFQGYITKLKNEVRTILDLASLTPINLGFDNSSSRFLFNNDAICSNDDFVMDFDNNPLVRNDESIAKAILEGYLIYIKDYIESNDDEVIMFTQQEVGGFLLADKINSDFPLTQDLIDSNIFKEKLIGDDEGKVHQLHFDILKFLIALKPDLILESDNKNIQQLSWWYLYNSDHKLIDGSIIEKTSDSFKEDFMVSDAVRASSSFWFNPEHRFNFSFIYDNLKKLSQWEYDLKWNLFIYSYASEIRHIINEYQEELSQDYDAKILKLKTKFIITILSSNIRELRDLATNALLSFGINNPIGLLDLTIDSRRFKDSYIYERMVHCCYGVTLNNQNQKKFVKDALPRYADKFFSIQFAQNTDKSVYNYIVTDSIKHIIDLSILKGVFKLNEEDYDRVCNYEFVPPTEWLEPSQEEQDIVDGSRERNPPEPIRMDFGIYTIPRLIRRDEVHPKIATANIWKRIFQVGFELLDLSQENDEIENDFHRGHKVYRFNGKVDRLGKKYCWIAFFDYAGKLLLDKQLRVWDKGDSSYGPYYERLGDVDIDISRPSKKHIVTKQLFFEDLLKDKRKGKLNWNETDKIDLIKGIFRQSFESDDYTLLYGFIDQREDETYDTRSFLKIESIFVDRKRLPEIIGIENKLFEWDDDINVSPSYLYDVYFGELYWADSVPSMKRNFESFPTGKLVKEKKYLGKHDLIKQEYEGFSLGDLVDIQIPEKIGIETEPTLMDYRWESNSEIFKTFGEFVPSSNLGKALSLKPDCISGNILDDNLKIATRSIEFEGENFYSSNYNFLRSDLLKEYINNKDLALVYQVKQHSYDKSYNHYRKLKFFIRK